MTPLADYLDSGAEGCHLEAKLKRRLQELETEIKISETDLVVIKSFHHPAVASGLQKG